MAANHIDTFGILGYLVAFIEESRIVKACQQPSQGRWTAWNSVQARELSWNDLWNMSDKRISMLIKASYDLLGTPSNLKAWNMQYDDNCYLCGKSPCNLKHILSNCSVALGEGRFTWRHDKLLSCIVSAVEGMFEAHNKAPRLLRSKSIIFLKKGESSRGKNANTRTSVLENGKDWSLMCDLNTKLVIPREIAITSLRPDIVMVSKELKKVLLCELTCPWEENAEWAHERKLEKYENLKNEIEENGRRVHVFAVEAGRGCL